MRILHCIPALRQAGAERQLVDLIAADHRHCHQVVTLAAGFGGSLAADLNAPPWTLARVMSGRVRPFKPDILVGWLYYGALMADSLRRLRIVPVQTPLIWSFHAADFNPAADFKPWTRFAIARCQRLSAAPEAIHYCAHAAAATHRRLGFKAQREIIIPNGIDVARFAPAARPLAGSAAGLIAGASADRLLRIGCAARFTPQKDHRTLLTAVAELKRRGSPVELVLAGDGCDEGNVELVGWIRAAGLDGTVRCLGPVSDMPAFYRSLDAAVLASGFGEAMPLTLVEAIASGLPVVATHVGDAARLVGEFGLIVPPQRPDLLAGAVAAVLFTDGGLADRARRSGPAAMAQRYSLAAAGAAWSALFASLGGARRAG
jgi:glycosyltransferase involved in cell wall biosynthesis